VYLGRLAGRQAGRQAGRILEARLVIKMYLGREWVGVPVPVPACLPATIGYVTG